MGFDGFAKSFWIGSKGCVQNRLMFFYTFAVPIMGLIEVCAGIKDLAYEKVEHPEVIDLLYSEAEKAKEKYPAEQTTDAPAQTEADAAPAA